jgi:hypothetical protein
MGYLKTIERLREPGGKAKPSPKPWLKAWKELARLTYSIEPGDTRLAPVLEALTQCDEAFYADNWEGFEQVARQIKTMMCGGRRHNEPAGTKGEWPLSRVRPTGADFPSLIGSARTTKPKEDTHETIV